MEIARPPCPPFSFESAQIKVRKAEDVWNLQNPELVSKAYTDDSEWRNRSEFLKGRDEIVAFLTRKWAKEHDYRLAKELWAYNADRLAVRFCYEYHDGNGQWYRAYGNENWQFDENGLMKQRIASINDVPIQESERLFFWEFGPRPEDHKSLSELGL
ncbi:MAG: nuclear transport factor 2 family protein [Pseudomonadales bacterium]|nr:nuclear transport factor 2 family protein [Pseudomonadales bacterium]